MKRSTKLALFLICATLANTLLIILICGLLLLAYSVTLARLLPAGSSLPAIVLCFVAALVLSTFLYKKLLGPLRRRFDIN